MILRILIIFFYSAALLALRVPKNMLLITDEDLASLISRIVGSINKRLFKSVKDS